MLRRKWIELLVGLGVAASLLLPRLASAQAPVLPGSLTAPAAAGQVGSFLPYSSSNPLYVGQSSPPWPVSLSGQYPTGSTPITGNSTGTTGAVVGSLAGTTGKTTYICGLNVSATGGTMGYRTDRWWLIL